MATQSRIIYVCARLASLIHLGARLVANFLPPSPSPWLAQSGSTITSTIIAGDQLTRRAAAPPKLHWTRETRRQRQQRNKKLIGIMCMCMCMSVHVALKSCLLLIVRFILQSFELWSLHECRLARPLGSLELVVASARAHHKLQANNNRLR